MKSELPPGISTKKILRFWLPLAATWLMMSVEGPFLAGVIARLGDPVANLAAWGVAFVVAMIVESPIIMLISASIALARNRNSFSKLKRFTYFLNAAITVVMVLFLATPAFDFTMRRLIGLPDDVASLTFGAIAFFLPWPAAIGYRRFYQGLLIRNNQTRFVAWGTAVRLTSMAAVALVLFFVFDLPGAHVGAAAASSGVVFEALASRIMATEAIKGVLAKTDEVENGEPLTYDKIIRFYSPLALTSTITLAVHPLITFFVGHSRFALQSLAVIPVVNSLSFVFRCLGFSYQEAGIALLGDRNESYKELTRFAQLLGIFASAGLSVIAFTPLAGIWYGSVAGLSAELVAIALLPTCIQALVPFFEVKNSLQRAVLVNSGRTKPITWATVAEVAAIVCTLFIAINLLDMIGVIAAATAMLAGRLTGYLFLIPYKRKALRA